MTKSVYCRLKFAKTTDTNEPFCLNFRAEHHPDEPLLDTSIEGTVNLCITWEKREEFIKALEELLAQYAI